MTVIIGIDPGVTGAVAVLVDGELFDVYDMPIITRELKTKTKSGKPKKRRSIDDNAFISLMRECSVHCPTGETPTAVIEVQQSMGVGGPVQTASIADQYAFIRGVVKTLGWFTVKAYPFMWKPDMGLSDDKRVSLAKANIRFPYRADLFRRGKDHDRAEAALLAAWWNNPIGQGAVIEDRLDEREQ